MRYLKRLTMLAAVALVAACGSATGATPTAAPPATAAATTPTAATPAPAAATTGGGAATQGAAAETYNGIPTGRTAEGYHVLGQINAPLTIEFFSDFL